MNITFNQYLQEKGKTFTFIQVMIEYKHWLEKQGLSSSWLSIYLDVKESYNNLRIAKLI